MDDLAQPVRSAFTSNGCEIGALLARPNICATQMTGQMARFYKLPMRASGVCAAMPDGQSMWKLRQPVVCSPIRDPSGLPCGWLARRGGRGPEKFIMDCEMFSSRGIWSLQHLRPPRMILRLRR